MSEAEAEILNAPISEQTRLALIYIAKMLERIDKRLERLCEILEGGISVETYKVM